jgi:hypothetical protein
MPISINWEAIMKRLFARAATTAFTLGGAVATAAELPTYELMGFPITPHQYSVIGSANVQERSLTPSLVLGGMPASPHQVTVLMPRARMIEEATAARLTKPSISAP